MDTLLQKENFTGKEGWLDHFGLKWGRGSREERERGKETKRRDREEKLASYFQFVQ